MSRATLLNAVFATWLAAIGLLACHPPSGLPTDAGLPFIPVKDAGTQPVVDAGRVDAGAKDAGTPFVHGYADEPCSQDAFAALDGGVPEGAVVQGLCIALGTVSGTSSLDGQAPQGSLELTFTGANQAHLEVTPDGGGAYTAKLMRGRYDQYLAHPDELSDHEGPKPFGELDLRYNDQARDLPFKTWTVHGLALVNGHAPQQITGSPNFILTATGDPPVQASLESTQGRYSARLLEGPMALQVSIPRAALDDTELNRYPVKSFLLLNQSSLVDVDLKTHQLTGSITVDGRPFPDRINGADFRLQYTLPGGQDPAVTTWHEGGFDTYLANVPDGTYGVSLDLVEVHDRSLPAMLFNHQIGVGVDLTHDQTLSADLKTFGLEGAISVDGVPVTPSPGHAWWMYGYSYPSPGHNWEAAYWEVPLESASFSLRALPGEYFLALYLDSAFHPDLAEGWYVLNQDFMIDRDRSLPIDIQTSALDGQILIDGQPASAAQGIVGTLNFSSAQGSFSKRIVTQDGTFTVRLPKDTYDVTLELDPSAYPEYAVGRALLYTGLDMHQGQRMRFVYDTQLVTGPLRVGGAELPDSLPGSPEAALHLRTLPQGPTYAIAIPGGRSTYKVRVPKGSYALAFELSENALSGVAAGTADLGNHLVVP